MIPAGERRVKCLGKCQTNVSAESKLLFKKREGSQRAPRGPAAWTVDGNGDLTKAV